MVTLNGFYKLTRFAILSLITQKDVQFIKQEGMSISDFFSPLLQQEIGKLDLRQIGKPEIRKIGYSGIRKIGIWNIGDSENRKTLVLHVLWLVLHVLATPLST